MRLGIPFSTFGAAAGATGAGFGWGTSSPDRMLSRFDSIPATACDKNEPQRDDCFAGVVIILLSKTVVHYRLNSVLVSSYRAS